MLAARSGSNLRPFIDIVATHIYIHLIWVRHSRKLWRGFKFGDLANSVKVAKLKICHIDYCTQAYGAKNSDRQNLNFANTY